MAIGLVDDKDVVSILKYFENLQDPRCSVNRKHLLGDLIVICICGVLAGADGPRAIGVWANSNASWLKKYLELPNGIPSHDTMGRLLALLKPNAFQVCFQEWIASLREDNAEQGAPLVDHIAIDGKALRRSHDRKKKLGALFLVSAWSVKDGISLGQLATEEKSNEITAIPQLIGQLDVEGAVVTIDAAGCQKEIAAEVIAGGGDYLLALKGNHPKLFEAVKEHVAEQIENDFADVAVRKRDEKVKGHGRVDYLTYIQLTAPKSLPGRKKWKKLRTIGVAIRTSEANGKETSDVRYYLSSMPLGVNRFAECVRGHWSIENTLHWCLDVTFREDESRLRDRRAAENVGWLRRFVLSLLKQQKDKESIAMRRRKAGWSLDYLAQVLGISTT